MSKTEEAGGYAFPHLRNDTDDSRAGMTLRDWFAGHALAGVLSFTTGAPDGCLQMEPKKAAREAYAMADAMIAERNKTATP